MNPTRRAYLDSYEALRPLAEAPELRVKWDTESVLKDFTVRGLAGHLIVRTGWAVLDYLGSAVEPGIAPIDAAAYYATVLGQMDAAEHEQVRVRGEAAAPDGPAGLLASYDQAAVGVADRLGSEPEERLVKVYGNLVMYLNDYLVTRIVEILVHADDLALSLGIDTPAFPDAAYDLATEHLLKVARLQHGGRAVLMAFSRRERDSADALRVF